MTQKRREEAPLQTVADLYLNAPLYLPYAFTESETQKVFTLINFPGPLDGFCIECQQPSIFSDPNARPRPPQQPMLGRGASIGTLSMDTLADLMLSQERLVHERWFTCGRDSKHQLFFVFRIEWHEGTLMKVGQYPSLATLATTEIKKYRKLLGEEAYREFSRAIGLAAHGIGIGAFVYLRRIIENLISEAHQAAQGSEGWDEIAYTDGRIVERIRLLRDYLPAHMVETSALYSILSKGIHDLSEQECSQAFPTIKLGIELILDQKLARQESEAKIARSLRDIGALHSQLKGREKEGEP